MRHGSAGPTQSEHRPCMALGLGGQEANVCKQSDHTRAQVSACPGTMLCCKSIRSEGGARRTLICQNLTGGGVALVNSETWARVAGVGRLGAGGQRAQNHEADIQAMRAPKGQRSGAPPDKGSKRLPKCGILRRDQRQQLGPAKTMATAPPSRPRFDQRCWKGGWG